jgi:hypothetical protein
MRYFQTLYNISFDDVIFDSTQEVAKRYDFKDAPSMKMVLSVIRRDFLILLTTRGRRSVNLPQCDMMTVPLASVNSLPISLNVDTCGSDTEDVSDPSDGCGFSNIWLRKEPGNYGVPPSFFKLCADGLKSPLLLMFNLSLSTGTFPSKWKDFFLISIFKTDKSNDVGNYRGVAILSCFVKYITVCHSI